MSERLPIDARTRSRIDSLGLEFLAEIYRAELQRHPENLDALGELGHVLTRLGRFEEGLEVDRILVGQCPGDPTALYNLACSLALLGRADEAVDTLEEAVRQGYTDLEHLEQDEDLANLHGLVRFETLLGQLRG